MRYVFGCESERKLSQLNSDLVSVVRLALDLSRCDFRVTAGMRSAERQRKLVSNGRSRMPKSMHQEGKAVDLEPCIDGFVNLAYVFEVADAMGEAATKLGIPLRWGGYYDLVNFPCAIGAKDLAKITWYDRGFYDPVHFELS